ncbi:hypothetical protein RJ639_009002 [Escallonia herrerae]|uniref:Uncharacterized protein n=1 Tax=Escallonia herrerae TaxID=1293975 RepID=A0AA88VX32_9ASTE|nr:hypothetical protein RJ639_009002 [Escallonia herrerae]
MEGEDSLRTVECLRGRLLAERAASRFAKEEADQMGNKLIELETQLKIEMKSRKRAEKRLTSLMRKLESLNISYVSDESENLSFLDKSEISSVSSTASSSTKEQENKEPNTQSSLSNKCVNVEPVKKTESPKISENLKHNVSQATFSSQTHSSLSSYEENSGSSGKAISEESDEIDSGQKYDDLKTDKDSLKSSVEDEKIEGEKDQDWDASVDNSLALVPVDIPLTAQKAIDPPIASASVREALDALRHAREKLLASMERRDTIKVGSR